MKDVELGKGAYGAVVSRNGYAYKKFEKAAHLIQEFAAGSYLRNVDAKCIIKVHEANHQTLELKMDLYDMNMREFMRDHDPSFAEKMQAFHDILWGLCELHERGLVHGDIKPGNILMKYKKSKESKSDAVAAYIGDLGFVSLAEFSKVSRTTAVYRDTKMLPHRSHDLYSLGIVMLELFGDMKVFEKLDHDEVVSTCEDKIKNKKFAKTIVSLTDDDYQKRPEASELLQLFFNVKFPKPNKLKLDHKHGLSAKTTEKFRQWIKPLCQKYKIKRGALGLKGLLLYISKYTEATKGHLKLHAGVMVIILSSLFGRSKFQEEEFHAWCKKKYTHSQLLAAIASLLACDEVIGFLMLQTKKN